jgi:4a-hydroxytetrahydrobiopterin dehydratase
MQTSKLSENEIQDKLTGIPEWTRSGEEISRTFEFSNFIGSMTFVNRLAEAAESTNHHPDIDIRYSKVSLMLTTHDSGGLTTLDFELAAVADELAG